MEQRAIKSPHKAGPSGFYFYCIGRLPFGSLVVRYLIVVIVSLDYRPLSSP
jgi:hypothetical protein